MFKYSQEEFYFLIKGTVDIISSEPQSKVQQCYRLALYQIKNEDEIIFLISLMHMRFISLNA